MWWIDHGVSLSELRSLTVLERARLKTVFVAKDKAKVRNSPQREAEHQQRLAELKQRTGQT